MKTLAEALESVKDTPDVRYIGLYKKASMHSVSEDIRPSKLFDITQEFMEKTAFWGTVGQGLKGLWRGSSSLFNKGVPAKAGHHTPIYFGGKGQVYKDVGTFGERMGKRWDRMSEFIRKNPYESGVIAAPGVFGAGYSFAPERSKYASDQSDVPTTITQGTYYAATNLMKIAGVDTEGKEETMEKLAATVLTDAGCVFEVAQGNLKEEELEKIATVYYENRQHCFELLKELLK